MVTTVRERTGQRRWYDVAYPRIDSPHGLFAFLLAFGVLNHVHTLRGLASDYDNVGMVVLIALSAAVLLKPESRSLFVLMTAALAVDVAFQSPTVVNHWLALGVTATAITVAGAWVVSLPRADRRDAMDAATMHVGAFSILTIWIFAAFHKLNTGFLDTVHSCAVSHTNDLTQLVGLGRPVDGGPLSVLLIAAALGAEVGVPVLLLRRSWRTAGLLLAFVFHMVMGVNGHQAFSGLALALYLPFMPARVWDGWRANQGDLWQRLAVRATQALGLGFVVVGFLLQAAGRDYNLLWRRRMFYVVVSTLILVALYRAWKRSSGGGPSTLRDAMGRIDGGHQRVIRTISLVVVALLTLNSIAAYLGIKSQLTISMYSNLRVESDELWNHLLVPEQVRIFDANTRVIEVRTIGSDSLGFLAGASVNEFELRRDLTTACRQGPVPLTYVVLGDSTVQSLADACQSAYGDAPSTLERKLLIYRDVIDPNGCQW